MRNAVVMAHQGLWITVTLICRIDADILPSSLWREPAYPFTCLSITTIRGHESQHVESVQLPVVLCRLLTAVENSGAGPVSRRFKIAPHHRFQYGSSRSSLGDA